jgi:hypothetical protein
MLPISKMTYPTFLSKRMRKRADSWGGSVSVPTSWSRSTSVALEAVEAPADMVSGGEATVERVGNAMRCGR